MRGRNVLPDIGQGNKRRSCWLKLERVRGERMRGSGSVQTALAEGFDRGEGREAVLMLLRIRRSACGRIAPQLPVPAPARPSFCQTTVPTTSGCAAISPESRDSQVRSFVVRMAVPVLVAPIFLLFWLSGADCYVEVSRVCHPIPFLIPLSQALTANVDTGLTHFQPMVSLLCGHGKFQNQYLDENKRWVTDPDPKATCTRDKLEILEYCRKVSCRLIPACSEPSARIMPW